MGYFNALIEKMEMEAANEKRPEKKKRLDESVLKESKREVVVTSQLYRAELRTVYYYFLVLGVQHIKWIFRPVGSCEG